jgi:heat shock protein HtpX
MAVLLPPLDDNRTQAAVLLGGFTFLTVLCLWLLFAWIGLLLALAGAGLAVALGPRARPEQVLALYAAEPVTERNGAPFLALLAELSRRAGLPAPPRLYVIPSATLSAFSMGDPANASTAITEGLVRRLTLGELAGPLAHEVAHVRAGDLEVLSLADGIARVSKLWSLLAALLLLLILPFWLAGVSDLPWLPLLILLALPALASALQLALPQLREQAADREAARLVGDPHGYATTLAKLDAYRGNVIEDLVLPMRRIPFPSVLRVHAEPVLRGEQLREAHQEGGSVPQQTPIRIAEAPMITALPGMGTSALQPRYRWPGVWY